MLFGVVMHSMDDRGRHIGTEAIVMPGDAGASRAPRLLEPRTGHGMVTVRRLFDIYERELYAAAALGGGL